MSKGHYILLGELALILLLLFLCIQGCNKTATLLKANAELTIAHNSNHDSLQLLKKVIQTNKQEYQDSLEFKKGELALSDIQKEATEQQLDIANNHIEKLLKERTRVTPSDTSTTIVPNEYIADCETCWHELKSSNDLTNKYRRDVEERDSFATAITVAHVKRQNQLEYERDQALKLATTSDSIANAAVQKFKPKGRLFITLGSLSINQPLPNAVGAGLKYQDRRLRLYGGKVYVSNFGKIYEAELSLPLSLKRH